MIMDDPFDGASDFFDKSEELSQLYELSTVEFVDLFKAKIPTCTSFFRSSPQQEVKFNHCEECCLLVTRLRYELK